MSIWKCETCGTLTGPNPGACPKCGSPTQWWWNGGGDLGRDLQVFTSTQWTTTCQSCETLKAENARLRAAQTWRPIEAAPKDGTPILIWVESPATGDRRTHRARWAIPYEDAPESRCWWETAYPRGHSPVVTEFVRGWMPWPEPPARTEETKP
jgi:hypothetical protein